MFADTGDLLEEVDGDGASGSPPLHGPARRQVGARRGSLNDPTSGRSGRAARCRCTSFAVDDPDGTELYVSAELGEVTVMTTRKSRTLAWIGTIPHWFYFAALRNNQPLWYQIVVWTSALGCVLALLGLVLGCHAVQGSTAVPVDQLVGATSPIPAGCAGTTSPGVIFGVFTLTWVFSGLLSMEPFGWGDQPGAQIPRDAFTGGAVELSRFPSMDPANVGAAAGRPRPSRKWSSSGSRTIRTTSFAPRADPSQTPSAVRAAASAVQRDRAPAGAAPDRRGQLARRSAPSRSASIRSSRG